MIRGELSCRFLFCSLRAAWPVDQPEGSPLTRPSCAEPPMMQHHCTEGQCKPRAPLRTNASPAHLAYCLVRPPVGRMLRSTRSVPSHESITHAPWRSCLTIWQRRWSALPSAAAGGLHGVGGGAFGPQFLGKKQQYSYECFKTIQKLFGGKNLPRLGRGCGTGAMTLVLAPEVLRRHCWP
jgi:hypothetical protein